MIVIFTLAAAFLAVFLICGWVCEHTPLGRHIDRLLAGRAGGERRS